MNINGKKAIVFGGTSGIGLSATQMLSDKGASVVAVSRNPEKLKEVDHIDRDPANFKSTNLRWVSRLDNHQNKGKPKHNTP